MIGRLVLQQTASDSLAAAEASGTAIGDIAAQLTLLAFLVVMILVPWTMARDSHGPRAPTPPSGSGTAGTPGAFTSPHERRLWAWTLMALLAIYSTLAPAAALAGALRERNLLRLTTGIVLVAVVAAMAVPWIRRRPGRREIGAAIGIAAVYVTTLIRMPVPEARSHLFEYGVVAMLIFHALMERRRNGRTVPLPPLIAVLATTLLGWVDELIQAVLPSRRYDLMDVAFNGIAAAMAVGATVFLMWARQSDVLGRIRRRV